jgi:hypothetical protein
MRTLPAILLTALLTSCTSGPEPTPEAPKARYRTDIVITTGVHGNEPSGYLARTS